MKVILIDVKKEKERGGGEDKYNRHNQQTDRNLSKFISK